MSRIEHQYPEIEKVLEGYNTPEHINDIKLEDMVSENIPIHDDFYKLLNKLYNKIRVLIEKYITDTYELKEFKVHIENKKTGEVVFSSDVIFPKDWLQKSVDVFASKYLIRNVETSIIEAVTRVVAWVSINGYRDGHLNYNYEVGGVKLDALGGNSLSVLGFAEKLTDIIIKQRGTFNSPVWFNVGNSENPMGEATTSACFVTKIEDNMGSIVSQNIVNQMIALNGSGSGCDMTPIRSRREWIGKQQGRPSGPIGFTGMFDAVLQATRSAGRFRRAAGLVSLKQYHPDILEYIRFKANEEKKGRILSDNMPEWDHEFSSESQFSIFGTLRVQNINTAVRLTKEFWDCADDGVGHFPLRDRNGTEIDRMDCEYLLGQIAQAQLECGDPGIQYDDNINNWNPFLSMGLRFNSSNACAEIQYLDNSACNLASLKITCYYDITNGEFDLVKLEEDIAIMLMAQDILIDFSYYPTKEIAQTSYNTRNLGLNYGDIGGLLYMMGLPYDSDEARCVAAVITGYFTACAHQTSSNMAETLGSFNWLASNDVAKDMNNILEEHRDALNVSGTDHPGLFPKSNKYTQYSAITDYLLNKTHMSHMRDSAFDKYDSVLFMPARPLRLRNATVTVFVPQGTVGLALGNMTSGIEPFISHAYNKDLVGGGNMKMGTHDDIRKIALCNCNKVYGDSYEMINKLNETALGTDGKNILSPMSHIKMMASVQPFISLAISKTCNMPSDTKVEDIIQLYKDAHTYGLKAVTIYVDGSKVLQPLKTDKKEDIIVKQDVKKHDVVLISGGFESLQDPPSVMLEGWAIQIGGEKFYVKFGWHPQVPNMLWEVWAEQSFCGGTIDGYTKTLAVMASRSFQKGIRSGNYEDIKSDIIKTWGKMTFPPNGLVVWLKGQPEYFNGIHSAQSFPNLLAQMIASVSAHPMHNKMVTPDFPVSLVDSKKELLGIKTPTCPECAKQMVKSGGSSHCFSCTCGNNVGGCG
jgi:ribonucleoside-diphosphate reductase alpha chain